MANTHSLDLELSSSQYAYCADGAAFDITGNISIEAWVKPESYTGNHAIVSKYESNLGNNRSYSFYITASGKLKIDLSDDGTGADTHAVSYTTDNIVVTAGTWFHVAVTFNIGTETCKIYVNGSLVANTQTGGTSIGASLYNSTASFCIGVGEITGTPYSYYDGLIDEVRLWSAERTAAEILANYNRELVGNESGLNAYYKLNNAYADSTSGGNTLTASGSPVFSTDVPTFPSGTGSLFYQQI